MVTEAAAGVAAEGAGMTQGWLPSGLVGLRTLAAAGSSSGAGVMERRRLAAVGRSPAYLLEERQGRLLWAQRKFGEPAQTLAAAGSSSALWSAGLRYCQGHSFRGREDYLRG